MNRRTHWGLGALTIVLAVVLAVPATAVDAFGTREVVVDADCRADTASGDAVRGAGGTTRGFVSFDGGTCGHARRVWWFTGQGDAWRARRTPYAGEVLATATDGSSQLVLFANADGTFLGRRRAGGGFTNPRRLSRHGLTGAVIPSGDVIGVGGRFWAVWSEQVGPGGEFAQTELFQSQNIGEGHYFDGVMRRTRITQNNDGDDFPTLAAEPTGAGEPTFALAWSRNDGARGEVSDLRFARATGAGTWAKTTFAGRGYNVAPDLFATNRVLWLAWTRNTRPVVTSLQDGTWRAGKTFKQQRALDMSLAVGGGHVFAGWTTPVGRDVKIAERFGGAWSVRNITPQASGDRQLLGVTTARGTATAIVARPGAGRVLAFSQD